MSDLLFTSQHTDGTAPLLPANADGRDAAGRAGVFVAERRLMVAGSFKTRMMESESHPVAERRLRDRSFVATRRRWPMAAIPRAEARGYPRQSLRDSIFPRNTDLAS
jgi:hypothetical protein